MAELLTLKSFERYCAIVAHIAVILGIPFFFLQQIDNQRSDAEKATLNYVQRFQDTDFVTARLDLFDEWKNFPVGLSHADMDSARDFARKDMMVRENNGDKRISTALFRFESFFAELSQCVDRSICSKDIASGYFQDFAHRLICLYEPYYTEAERSFGVKGFGAGIWKIAENTDCKG